ncbi:MAG: mechanosensitive ion channel domain-containing protein [Spirulinaceae cyanobacterium]
MSRFFKRPWLATLLGLLTLLIIITPTPSLAQIPWNPNLGKAPVMLDGEELFKVQEFASLSAFERAELVNETLEKLVNSSQKVEIEVAEEEGSVVIRAKGEEDHILTVTQGDLANSLTPHRQASVWQRRIKQALKRGQEERRLSYYRRGLLLSLVALAIAIAVHYLIKFLGRFTVKQSRKLLANINFSQSVQQPTINSLRLFWLISQITLWFGTAYYITDIFPQTRGWRYRILTFLFYPLITIGDKPYSILQLLLLLVFIIGIWFGVRSFIKLLKIHVFSKIGADKGLEQVLSFISQYLLTFFGVILILQIWGVDVSSLAIFASALGVGIGFGVQNIANNFISGVIITIEQPIKVGDFVEIKGLEGIIKRIGARSTEILTLDQVAIIVPNSSFLQNEVINRRHGNSITRLKVPVGVAYGSNIKEVKTALLEAATGHNDVLYRPKPEVWFQEFGDSSLNFELLVWTKEPQEQPRIKSDLNYGIDESLRRHNIEVPFPQRDLNLRSPVLEELISTWLNKNGGANHNSTDFDPEIVADFANFETQEPPSDHKDREQPLVEISHEPNELTPREIETLVKAMRGTQGLEIQDRNYRFKRYRYCFLGSEAVDWLVEKQQCSRQEAVELGQMLIEKGIIHHVADEQSFVDGYYFYRFYTDEQKLNY